MDRSTVSERQRLPSVTSRRYYEAENVDQKMKSFIESTKTVKQKNLKTKQSKHLPYWAWYIIAKCNGIPLHKDEKPILGTILHTLTFAGALTFSVSNVWLVVYDIISPNTPQDIPGGTVSILLVFCWCAFGYYCKTLSSRLFCHPRFLKDIRMHSRTVFKINAAFLVMLFGALFTSANVYEALKFFDGTNCTEIDLDEIVCLILSVSSITISVFALIWHCLVSFVFISVCRTHTIGLRRFIREIEHDAVLLQQHHSAMYKNFSTNQDDVWQESLWMAEQSEDDEYYGKPAMNYKSKRAPRDFNSYSDEPTNSARPDEISILFSPLSENLGSTEEDSAEQDWNYLKETTPSAQCMDVIAARDSSADSSSIPNTMSAAEIMNHCWKMNCRLHFSSLALQRWFASFIALVLLRSSTYLVHWLRHVATVCDVIQFIVPLLILIVLAGALAEVNVEGQRALRRLYPTEDRLKMLQFLALNPLQMSIYGYGMTHGTIVTVIFAILVGFVTRIIITEMTK